MEKERRIVLVGDSLLLDAVESSLNDNLKLGLQRIHSKNGQTAERLLTLAPDLVIFDLSTSELQSIVPLLKDHPQVQLIGLDACCSQVVALSGQPYTTPTASDLASVISASVTRTNGSVSSSGIASNGQSHGAVPLLTFP